MTVLRYASWIKFFYFYLFIWPHQVIVAAFRLLAAACGIQFPDQGSKPHSLHWEHWVLATVPLGKSHAWWIRCLCLRRVSLVTRFYEWRYVGCHISVFWSGISSDTLGCQFLRTQLQNQGASLAAWWYRIHLPMQETWVWSLGREDPQEKEMTTHSSILVWENPMDRGAWWATVHGVATKSQAWLTD